MTPARVLCAWRRPGCAWAGRETEDRAFLVDSEHMGALAEIRRDRDASHGICPSCAAAVLAEDEAAVRSTIGDLNRLRHGLGFMETLCADAMLSDDGGNADDDGPADPLAFLLDGLLPEDATLDEPGPDVV